MENRIESNYIIKIDEVLKNLKLVDDTLGGVEDTINKTGKNQSFSVLGKQVENYNRVLSNGESIYRKIEGGARSYKVEVERLQKVEKDLIKTQAEFKNSADYDQAEKNLQAVRKRMSELNSEIENTGKKQGGVFSNLGGLIKGVGLAMVAFFTVDKLVDLEGQIIENTKAYEKYYAVLKNGFQDENKASEALALIYEFASETPFAVDEITQSFIKLNNRGFTPTKEELVKLGDIAASQGKSFDQLTEGILDAMTGEFERLKEFGITSKTIGDNVTLSFKGQETTVNKFNQGALKEAILGFGELKGVTGSMSAVSQTLEGRISNLGDSWSQLLTSLGKSQGFLSGIVSITTNLINTLKLWVDVPVEKKLAMENAELNTLGRSLILANNNEAIKSKLLTEISQKYPSFLALLGKESDNTYAIENALKLVNEQYRIKIRLAGQDVLAKRNAEKLADVYESQASALGKVEKVLLSSGKSVAQFSSLTKLEQSKIIDDLAISARDKASKRQTFDLSSEFGKIRGKAEENKIRSGFDQYYKEVEKQNRLEQNGIDIQTKKVDLTNQEVVARNSAISKMRQENIQLEKNLISKKDFEKIISYEYKTKQEEKKIANYLKFQANKEEIVTFSKQGQELQKDPPKNTSTSKSDKPNLKETQSEIDKLIEQEKKYLDTINKMSLESKNVRLSLLDKNSKEYINAKREYDLELVEQERISFVELYKIQVANEILKEELAKRGSKVSEEEIKILKENAEKRAEIIANGNGSNSFDNSKDTKSQRGLLSLKKSVIDFNYANDVKTFEDKTNKEQLDRLEQHNALIGEGLEKQIITIQNKYNKLIETYEKDLELVKRLEIKRAEEIGKARFNSSDKAIDDSNAVSKKTIEGRDVPKGVSQVEFEAKNKRDLLELDIAFYAEKYRLLKEYLASSQFEQSDKNGQISKEEKDTYQTRLDNYKKGLQGANSSLDVFVKTSTETGKVYKDNWDVIGDVFKTVTGKALSFSEDKEVDKKIKDSIDTTLNAVKDAYSNILQAQIDSSNERIAQLDSEISERQGRVNQEFENYKAGYANNYLEEKKSLDLKKKERADELENKKKLQKEQAVIDTLTIISTNAVTVATLIKASADAFSATAPIPFVGVAYAIAAVATIVATMATISAKAKQATKFRYGGEIFGNLHESGGVNLSKTGIEVEGGEFVTRREQVKKQPTLFEALNNDTFGSKSFREQHEMLKPFGMKLANDRERVLKIDMVNKEKREKNQVDNSIISRQFTLIAEGLKSVAENTSNISPYDYIQSGNETLKFNKKGRIVEIIKKQNE